MYSVDYNKKRYAKTGACFTAENQPNAGYTLFSLMASLNVESWKFDVER
jgi:hypothetical protein